MNARHAAAALGLTLAAAAAIVFLDRDPAGRAEGEGPAEAPLEPRATAAPEAPVPLAVLGGRTRSARTAAEVPPDLVPTARAVAYLLGCQGEDGLFREDLGARDGDPPASAGSAVATTALVCLALVDVVSPTEEVPAARAARRGLDRLAALQSGDGSFAEDAEAEALAQWALAAGASRSGRADYGATVPRSLRRALDAAHRDGGWISRRGAAYDLVVTAWRVAFLFEALALEDHAPEAEPAREAVELAGLWATSVADEAGGGAAAAAAALLRRLGGDPTASLDLGAVFVGGGIDHAGSCLGTVFAFHDEGRWPAWRERAFLPALELQHREGPRKGSWDPWAGRGRVQATALETLAFLSVAVPYREARVRADFDPLAPSEPLDPEPLPGGR